MQSILDPLFKPGGGGPHGICCQGLYLSLSTQLIQVKCGIGWCLVHLQSCAPITTITFSTFPLP